MLDAGKCTARLLLELEVMCRAHVVFWFSAFLTSGCFSEIGDVAQPAPDAGVGLELPAESGCSACALDHATARCASDTCVVDSCDQNYADCNGLASDGCEVDVTSAAEHCGGCGQTCGEPQDGVSWSCSQGSCNKTGCLPGRGDCDGMSTNGCEVDLTASPEDCGQCAIACPLAAHAAAACANGSCSLKCAAGYADCKQVDFDGCETDIAGDELNCGGCGVICPTGANSEPRCGQSSCTFICNAGFADCDGDETPGCETQLTSHPGTCP